MQDKNICCNPQIRKLQFCTSFARPAAQTELTGKLASAKTNLSEK